MFTDDAYARGYTGCEPFGPGEDYDPMYEGPGDAPKCGGSFLNEYGEREGCPGCRHCFPPDHEAKPYGFGVETFEHEPSQRLARELCANGPVTFGVIDRIDALPLARRWTGFSYRRLRQSEIVWGRLCDDCETHGDAVEKYGAWAKRAATVRYRDEPRPVTVV